MTTTTTVTPANFAAKLAAKRRAEVARQGHLRRAKLAADVGNHVLAAQLRAKARS